MTVPCLGGYYIFSGALQGNTFVGRLYVDVFDESIPLKGTLSGSSLR